MKTAHRAIVLTTAASIAMLAACSDDKKSKIDPEADPDLFSEALEKVQFAGQDAERKEGELPAASTDAAAPSIILGDKLFPASQGQRVSFPFSVNSDSALSSLFAKVVGAPDFFQVSLTGSTKMASDYSFGFGLPNNILDGTACFDLAAQDDAGLVGRSDESVCIEIVAPTATPTPTAAPTAAPTTAPTPTTNPTGSPTGSPTPAPTGGVTLAPTAAPTPTMAPGTGGSAAACFNSDVFAEGTQIVFSERSTTSNGTEESTTEIAVGGQTSFDGRTAQISMSTVNTTNSATGSATATVNQYTQTNFQTPSLSTVGAEITTSGVTTTTRLNPAEIMRYDLDAGQQYSQTYTLETETSSSFGTFTSSQTVSTTTTYVGRKQVTVPAGTFDVCEFREQSGSDVTTSFFDVGSGILVKQISGDTTSELLSATINGTAVR